MRDKEKEKLNFFELTVFQSFRRNLCRNVVSLIVDTAVSTKVVQNSCFFGQPLSKQLYIKCLLRTEQGE